MAARVFQRYGGEVPEPFKPVLTITTTAGNVSDLRTRVVRERLRSDGRGGAALVREVFEAHVGPEPVEVLTMDLGEVQP